MKGVTKRIKLYFFTYPHSSAKQCCEMLGLGYKKYRRLCWNLKSQTKKLLASGVQGRLLSPLKHRETMSIELPREVVDCVIFEASKRRPKKGAELFDEWYVIPNRNRMMLIRNNYVSIKVFPKSGTCRVLPIKPMPFEWIQIAVQHAFWKAGVELDVSEKLGESVEPSRKHRIFKVGPLTPFKIEHYRKSLGLTILADGSHPDFLETEEDFPSWIKPLFRVVSKGQDHLESVVDRFEKSMDKHLELIDVFRRESEERARAFKRTKRRARRKPKPLSRWQMLKKTFSLREKK